MRSAFAEPTVRQAWPRTRAAFWKKKIEGNRARDRKVNRLLRARGWTVLRIWEHDLRRKDEVKLLRRLKRHAAK